MMQLKAIAAYVVTYGAYTVMWMVFTFYLLAGYSVINGWWEEPLSWIIAAIGLGIFTLAVKGFAEWSRPRRERLRELSLEAEDPSMIEVHRKKQLEG